MTQVNIDAVKTLREMTGAGMMDCKNSLQEAGGDIDKAVVLLRERGIAKAAKKIGRETSNGVIEAYLHRTGDYPPQTGALVEVNCESDFVAKGEDFRALARELALHITAAAPRWINRDEVPADLIQAESELFRRTAEQDGKPAGAIEKIVSGQVEAFYKQNVLMDQVYVRDAKVTIKDLIAANIGRLGENITVRRFSRFNIKEA
ncbi:MAG TPA: translation elongation factor Ts [Candidatus Dormibacteraeota bacterium]|nr:translation elongation factor Ts [Candidatus Dormibacteraeota bacterium]